MEELFDALAKDVSGKVSRRQAFGRFGWGLVVTAFAALGLTKGNEGQDCVPKCCELACRSDRRPEPGGVTPGECMRACLAGASVTGQICARSCA